MKRNIALVLVMMTISLSVFGKRDVSAWKTEIKLEKQFEVFKANLKVWGDYMYLREVQMDELFTAVNDTVANLRTNVFRKENSISNLNSTVAKLKIDLSSYKSKYESSVLREDSMFFLGINLSKSSFLTIVYLTIFILLFSVAMLYHLYSKSNRDTKIANAKCEDLENEFDENKKRNLERFTKLNRELHDARMKAGDL